MQIFGFALLLLSATGTLCLTIAAVRLWGLGGSAVEAEAGDDPVSILKPLYGTEAQLLANLSTFLRQDHAGSIQLICGVQRVTDPAIAVVKSLKSRFPTADIELVIDEAVHGTNAKISNLINIAAEARHPILILSDSDMAVEPDYVSQVLSALRRPDVGAVTCLYRGRGDAGGWSRLAAMNISQRFLPSILLGTIFGLATPCMGSTIALRRTMLDAIGGLGAFTDLLADDYAIGEAVRAAGKTVVLPDIVLTHACTETSLAALVKHELRWNRTIAGINRAGFLGSIVLHPLPIALLAGVMLGLSALPVVAILGALVVRTAIALLVDRDAGNRTAPLLWIPARDLLSFILFIWTFFGTAVDWRGTAFTVESTGRLSTHQDRNR